MNAIGAGSNVTIRGSEPCNFCHATDVDITRLPQRRTDGARIVDLDKHYVKLYTADGGVKLIKRCALWGEVEAKARLGAFTLSYLCFSGRTARLIASFGSTLGNFRSLTSKGGWVNTRPSLGQHTSSPITSTHSHSLRAPSGAQRMASCST